MSQEDSGGNSLNFVSHESAASQRKARSYLAHKGRKEPIRAQLRNLSEATSSCKGRCCLSGIPTLSISVEEVDRHLFRYRPAHCSGRCGVTCRGREAKGVQKSGTRKVLWVEPCQSYQNRSREMILGYFRCLGDVTTALKQRRFMDAELQQALTKQCGPDIGIAEHDIHVQGITILLTF